jgi:GNAT superfamily N-acetyltransferase
MFHQPIRHRRARRTDFDAVSAILAASGLPAPQPERAGLRRFRRLVADLGADFYVAEIAARVVGLVHVTYGRRLIGGAHARLELLVVAPETRGQGVGRSLIQLAASRARRRGCAALRCTAAPDDQAAQFLGRVGWRPAGQELEFDLTDLAQ